MSHLAQDNLVIGFRCLMFACAKEAHRMGKTAVKGTGRKIDKIRYKKNKVILGTNLLQNTLGGSESSPAPPLQNWSEVTSDCIACIRT